MSKFVAVENGVFDANILTKALIYKDSSNQDFQCILKLYFADNSTYQVHYRDSAEARKALEKLFKALQSATADTAGAVADIRKVLEETK